MRARYSASASGKLIKTADVYTAEEHGIPDDAIDPDAVKVTGRLQRAGFEAYVVGGAVRDLLLGKYPKDFDVATSATPAHIRKLFRNSRIIGKRFRLAHILFRDKIIEVSTFRAQESEGFKNVYGSIEEDVWRRDFTANALYFDPAERTVIDYVGGVADIRKRTLRPIIPPQRIFQEDPVRMIRAIKYSVAGDLRIPWLLARRIKREAVLLAQTPASRMTEELFKILTGGMAAAIVQRAIAYRMLGSMVPEIDTLQRAHTAYRSQLIERLSALDERRAQAGFVERHEALAALCGDALLNYGPYAGVRRIVFRDAYFECKRLLQPVTPANRDVEEAVAHIFRHKRAFGAGGPLF